MAKSCKIAIDFLAKSCEMAVDFLAKSCKYMLKRKIINDLTEWKKNVPNKALLIKGARQVGKTTVVRQFAKANYKNYLIQ